MYNCKLDNLHAKMELIFMQKWNSYGTMCTYSYNVYTCYITLTAIVHVYSECYCAVEDYFMAAWDRHAHLDSACMQQN